MVMVVQVDEELANKEVIMSPKTPNTSVCKVAPPSRYKWWLRIITFTIFILAGQSIATLLLRLYFDQGGNSQWMATLVQMVGFPILIPFMFIYIYPTRKNTHPQNNVSSKPSLSILVSLYIFLGVLFAINCSLVTLGVANLPVSTFSLILASQLAFNAVFSYFLNAQKFTPLIINSLFLLTISSALLVLQTNVQQGSSSISKTKYALGFLCTVGGAATGGLLLSVTQFAFRKIVKTTTLKVVFDLVIYQCLVASILIVLCLFVSKEWKSLRGEMEEYKHGKASYVITLVGAAMSWQIFAMGLIGLVFEISSLFSNIICALGLPIVPIFAVVFFHDDMSGVKVIALLLAVWGFVSYIYQEYLDDSNSNSNSNSNSKAMKESSKDVNEVCVTESVTPQTFQ